MHVAIDRDFRAVLDFAARDRDVAKYGCCGPLFDTVPDRATAEEQLAELRARTESLELDFSKFWTTYDNWKTGILNYFDGRYTSAAVEGINNKARVITKRCYGVKSAGTLFSPADSGPESGLGGGWPEYRRAAADRRQTEGRVSRVLHLKPEEPTRIAGGVRRNARDLGTENLRDTRNRCPLFGGNHNYVFAGTLCAGPLGEECLTSQFEHGTYGQFLQRDASRRHAH